jgi:hypothetical protein
MLHSEAFKLLTRVVPLGRAEVVEREGILFLRHGPHEEPKGQGA